MQSLQTCGCRLIQGYPWDCPCRGIPLGLSHPPIRVLTIVRSIQFHIHVYTSKTMESKLSEVGLAVEDVDKRNAGCGVIVNGKLYIWGGRDQ